MIALGVDIGGTSVKAAARGADGSWRMAQSAPYRAPDLDTLRGAIASCLEALDADSGTAAPTGLCLPGLRDPATGRVTRSVNIPALVGIHPTELIARAPVLVLPDARAAAFDVFAAEHLTGRLAALSLGTGVGLSVLDDGVPLLVSGESPGHFGQIDVSIGAARDAPIGPDGGRGGLEGYIGLPALSARFGARLPEALAPDDPALLALARAVRILHAIYRPDHVRLLGGVGLWLRDAAPTLAGEISDALTAVARPEWTLGFARDAFHAARGAARFADRSVRSKA